MKWPKFIVYKRPDHPERVFTLAPEQMESGLNVAFFSDRNAGSIWHDRVTFRCGKLIDMPEGETEFVYYTPEEDALIVEMVMAKFLATRPGRSKKKQPAGN